MADTKIDILLERLGQNIAKTVDGMADGCYLHAEVVPGMAAPALFKDEGNRVVYLFTDDEFTDILFDLWEAAPEDKRWQIIHYEINDGKFDARFEFPEDIDQEEWVDDRQNRAIEARYGDKLIVYPQGPDGAHELSEEDLLD